MTRALIKIFPLFRNSGFVFMALKTSNSNATFQPLAGQITTGYLTPMYRSMNALVLSLVLVLTSYSMAVARGQSPDVGTEMVICTGVGMITMTIGSDGEPVETAHICPDAMSLFATALLAQDIPAQAATMQWRAVVPDALIRQPQETLSPSARGPPLAV